MTDHVILLGASAGGVNALSTLARGLPADFPAPVFVVLHLAPFGKSSMPFILSRAGRLPAVHAEDLLPIEKGVVYIAPPDHHVLVEREVMRLSRGRLREPAAAGGGRAVPHRRPVLGPPGHRGGAHRQPGRRDGGPRHRQAPRRHRRGPGARDR